MTLLACQPAAPTLEEQIATIQARFDAYRAASKAGQKDAPAVTSFRHDTIRIWWGSQEGEGRLSVLSKPATRGAWADWDSIMHGSTTYDTTQVDLDARTLYVVYEESNDFFRAMDIPSNQLAATYYFDEGWMVTGRVYQSNPNGTNTDWEIAFNERWRPWLDEHYPGVVDTLLPGGELDPRLENALRWQQLFAAYAAQAG